MPPFALRCNLAVTHKNTTPPALIPSMMFCKIIDNKKKHPPIFLLRISWEVLLEVAFAMFKCLFIRSMSQIS